MFQIVSNNSIHPHTTLQTTACFSHMNSAFFAIQFTEYNMFSKYEFDKGIENGKAAFVCFIFKKYF